MTLLICQVYEYTETGTSTLPDDLINKIQEQAIRTKTMPWMK